MPDLIDLVRGGDRVVRGRGEQQEAAVLGDRAPRERRGPTVARGEAGGEREGGALRVEREGLEARADLGLLRVHGISGLGAARGGVRAQPRVLAEFGRSPSAQPRCRLDSPAPEESETIGYASS
ncbi:hypothetical protein [Sorangium sp. So ce341]|uniref:hypothetical protein n=1 Tax=Sorangium sp. So ce341 TaxID=3133302 RepID=UPI003F5D8014